MLILFILLVLFIIFMSPIFALVELLMDVAIVSGVIAFLFILIGGVFR